MSLMKGSVPNLSSESSKNFDCHVTLTFCKCVFLFFLVATIQPNRFDVVFFSRFVVVVFV